MFPYGWAISLLADHISLTKSKSFSNKTYVQNVLGLYAFLVVLYVFMIVKITNTIDGNKSLNKRFTCV